MKRFLDALIALTAIVLLVAPTGAIALLILATMGRPVFFRQARAGQHERMFSLIKFRTMRLQGPGEPAGNDAARLTPLGRFLRGWSLDELPSLWNVLRGDMSLVGPRPLLPEYLPRYTPEQARRHEVKPGITGLAQVSGRNATTWEERLRLDVWYVDHRNFWLDIKILARTVLTVLRREGISASGHATMPEFMGTKGE